MQHVARVFLVLSGSGSSCVNWMHTLWWVWTRACDLSIAVRTWGHVIPSIPIISSIMRPDGRSSSASSGSAVLVYPSLVVGVSVAVLLLFQLGSGGLTLTSFFLKLFIYVSFALLCFLLGSFGLLVRKSPLKISRFDTTKRQSAKLADLFNKLMVRMMMMMMSHHNISTLTSTDKQQSTLSLWLIQIMWLDR